MNQAASAALSGLLSRPEVVRVLAALACEGEETRIVGGAVRDALLGRPVADLDLATTLLPAATLKRARTAGLRAIPTGLAHGTVTILAGAATFEVTTLREDVDTDGRHATVRFGRDFHGDALRRDFTMNALSFGADGRLHDYTGGLDDLAARHVRFIGDPDRRIREDFLRALRFFRFSAEHGGGAIDREGLLATIRERAGLRTLSRERVRAELLRLVAAEHAVVGVTAMSDAGLLAILTGGIADAGRLGRAAGAEATARDPVLRLSALLVRTGEDAERLTERLRLSNAERDRLVSLAAVASRLHSADEIDAREVRRLAADHGVATLLEAAAIADGEPRPILSADARDTLARYRSGEERAPVFPLTGGDLIRRGVQPGPEIGRLLAEARQAWMEAGCLPGWVESTRSSC